MKQYGFFVIERKRGWRARLPDGSETAWLPTKARAEQASTSWKEKAQKELDVAFNEAKREVREARRGFIAETKVEIVTVDNPARFQRDFEKPTVCLPDGAQIQFEQGTPKKEIDSYIKAAAREAHPDPERPNPPTGNPTVEELNVWEAELILEGQRHNLPAIDVWSRFFPMEAVSTHLNELAADGWSVVHVSEDRGLYKSAIAANMSAPLVVRYLLARDTDGQTGTSPED